MPVRHTLRQLAARFWSDESGFVISSELVVLSTLLTIGVISGLTAMRDGVVQEFGDGSQALNGVQQSYQYAGVEIEGCGTSAGSLFQDRSDYCTPRLSDDSPPQLLPAISFVSAQATGGE